MSFTPLVRLIPSYFIIFEAIVNESMSIICFSVCAHVKRRGDQEKPVAPGYLWPERQKAGWKVGRDTSRECAQTERPIVSLRELLLRNRHPRCSSGVTVAMKESSIYRGEQQTRKGFKIISTGHDDFRENKQLWALLRQVRPEKQQRRQIPAESPPNDQNHTRRRYKNELEGFRVKERELKLKTGKRVAS